MYFMEKSFESSSVNKDLAVGTRTPFVHCTCGTGEYAFDVNMEIVVFTIACLIGQNYYLLLMAVHKRKESLVTRFISTMCTLMELSFFRLQLYLCIQGLKMLIQFVSSGLPFSSIHLANHNVAVWSTSNFNTS